MEGGRHRPEEPALSEVERAQPNESIKPRLEHLNFDIRYSLYLYLYTVERSPDSSGARRGPLSSAFRPLPSVFCPLSSVLC